VYRSFPVAVLIHPAHRVPIPCSCEKHHQPNPEVTNRRYNSNSNANANPYKSEDGAARLDSPKGRALRAPVAVCCHSLNLIRPNHDPGKGCFTYFRFFFRRELHVKKFASPFNGGFPATQGSNRSIRFAILQATPPATTGRIIFFCGRPFRHAACGDRLG
jgi:hypothetical protein